MRVVELKKRRTFKWYPPDKKEKKEKKINPFEDPNATFKERYNYLIKQFFKAINYHDIELAKWVRKMCVWEYLYREGYSDEEKVKLSLLAFDCTDFIRGRWGEHNQYPNEFYDYLKD